MIRIGIIGTGRIAHRFVPEAGTVQDLTISSVYNPKWESARRFAEELSLPIATDNLENFLEHIDAAYIASPHPSHFEYARFLLQQGKHVLCEKPLCFQRKQAKALYELAREKNCILMEAIKTAYCPGYLAMMKMAEGGIIGEIRDVEACFTRLTERNTRERSDLQWGGSVTEFGSYTLLPIIRLLGSEYEKISFQSIFDERRVDEYTKVFLEYEKGMGLSKTGLAVKSEGQLVIAGTKGYILAESPWWLTRKFELRFENPAEKKVFEFPFEGQGLRYEIEAFCKAVCERKQNDRLNRDISMAMAGIMERFLEWKKYTE